MSRGKDRRVVLAKWLASQHNPWFATSFANRVWAHFMGAGIVEQVDDFRVSNPASNPELLDALGKHFTDTKYDLKAAGPRYLQLADLSAIDAAQREQRERRAEFRPRPGPADQGREPARHHQRGHRHQGQVRRAAPGCPRRPDRRRQPSTYFLKTFGRATRETPCSCEVKMEPTLSQALHLLNGDTVNAKIKQGGLITKLIATKKFPEERITELYIRTSDAQADQGRARQARARCSAKSKDQPRRSKISSGHAQ